MIHSRHDARHPVLGLGQQRHHQVYLVIAGCGDHHLRSLQLCVVEGADLAGVGEQPFGPWHGVQLDLLRLIVDQQHLVPVLEELAGDGTADGAGAGDRDPHQCPPPRVAKAATIRSSSLSLATTWSTSPSCRTVPGSGTNAWPSRSTKAIRLVVLPSIDFTCSPIQADENPTSAST